MNNVARVSVVIAAYNAAHTLEETLASVAAQTYRDFEVIVVDDGSTDATPALLAECEAKWPWMKWVRQENAGVSVARNHAAELAHGEIIALLDADDLWLPDKLALQVPLFDRNPEIAVVYTDMAAFPEDLRTTEKTLFQQKPPARGRILQQYFMGNFILTSTAMVRTSAFHAVGGFDPTYSVIEDVEFFLRLAERFDFDYVDKVLVKYRVQPTSLSHTNPVANQLSDLRIFDQWVKRRPDLFPENSAHVRLRRATVYARMGRTLFDRGDYASSRSAYRHAFALGNRGMDTTARLLAAHVPVLARGFKLVKSRLERRP